MKKYGNNLRVSTFLACCLTAVILLLCSGSNCAASTGKSNQSSSLDGDLTVNHLAAHACGEYNGIRYTNSLDALNANYKKGFRLYEIDFNYTSDGRIVLIHDWIWAGKRLLGQEGKTFSYAEFKQAKPARHLTLMALDDLASWLKTHRDVQIITDCKKDNVRMLKAIAENHPEMTRILIPQMGGFQEYAQLSGLGYRNIILALYKTHYKDSEVLQFVKNHSVYAVSMTEKRAETSLPSQLKKQNIRVFAHTVNSFALARRLYGNGVYGIYTDSILPRVYPQTKTSARPSPWQMLVVDIRLNNLHLGNLEPSFLWKEILKKTGL